MPVVLIVDDSPVDRRLIGGILEKEEGFQVEYASNGDDALHRIEARLPDLVLTDLIMPNRDGLHLVTEVRRRFPSVPTVVMTSAGNEEIAVTALHKGAASYVPKHVLSSELLATIMNVLEVARKEQGYHRLMQFMVAHQMEFMLGNDLELIAPMVGFLQESLARMGLCDEADKMRLGIALDEALTNALYHGNLELNSDLRESDGRAYQESALQRACQPPYCDRRIRVSVQLSPGEARIEVRDEGPGFDPSKLPDPTDPANLDRVSGRGVLLMRTFMDEVVYNSCGNCVTLIKRKSVSICESFGNSSRIRQ